jgi:hypothetical protein
VLAACACLSLTGCFRASVSTDDPPPGDALATPVELFRHPENPDAAGLIVRDAATCPPPSGLSWLTFHVSTSPAGGRFAPKNVGAIWVTTEGGAFVRTLAAWGTTRLKWLSTWLASSGGDTVDAVTGATLVEHRVHEVVWDLKDQSGCEVPAGAYVVRVELTDRDGLGEAAAVPFMKGTTPVAASASDTRAFQDMRLTLE